jgi:hypothetical protein
MPVKKKHKKAIKNNIIRKISDFILDNFSLRNIKINKFYMLIHSWFIGLLVFVALFNNNVYHLIILLIIISLDAFSVVVLHQCPLTILEKKYLKISSSELRTELLKNMNIVYECDHEYEKHIELLINSWTIIAGKCLIILFLKTFNLKLYNYNNIYI